MGSEWREAFLTELYEIGSGLSKPAKDFGTGYPFLAFKDVFYNFFVPESLSQLVRSSEKERESCSVRRGDIFLTRTSETMHELGMSCVALKDYEHATFNGFTKRLRPKAGIDVIPEYAGYFLRSSKFRNEMMAFSTMSTRASLNNEMISCLKLVIPPLPEQKAIAHVLGSLDDRIELNRRMNETLEAMAQALFKRWFVDFDPVIDNALAGGKEIPAELSEKAQARAALGGKRQPLPEEIRTLFPDEFTYSDEMGWIPKGWEVGLLADVCFVKGGYAFKSKDFTTSGYPVIKIKNINNDRTVNATDVQFIPKDIANKVENFWLSPGDLIMAMTGATVGKFGLLVPEMEKTYLLNQRVAKFFPIDKISPQLWFVFCCLCQKNVFDYIVNVAHGSAQPNVSADTIMATTTLRPDDKVIQVFNNAVDGDFVKMLSNRETVQTLSKLRDTLLPKLLSGEIRIPDAEKMVEELAL